MRAALTVLVLAACLAMSVWAQPLPVSTDLTTDVTEPVDPASADAAAPPPPDGDIEIVDQVRMFSYPGPRCTAWLGNDVWLYHQIKRRKTTNEKKWEKGYRQAYRQFRLGNREVCSRSEVLL